MLSARKREERERKRGRVERDAKNGGRKKGRRGGEREESGGEEEERMVKHTKGDIGEGRKKKALAFYVA